MNKPKTVKTVTGPIEAMPCPHCGVASDLRGFRDMAVLDQGATSTCDHCKRPSKVMAVVPFIAVTWGTESGAMSQVKCPACKTVQDMTEIYEMGLLERGNKVTCDRCNATFPIVRVAPVTHVTLAPRR